MRPNENTLLVATMHKLLALDPFTGACDVLHQGAGSYYGIAYNADGFYVACRGDVQGHALPFIGRFHWDGTLVEQLRAPFALSDMHQALFIGGVLWVVCAGFDGCALYRGHGDWFKWCPEGARTGADKHHFNSVERVGSQVFLLAHNQPPGVYDPLRPSQVWVCNADGQTLERLDAGFCAHNVALVGPETWVCDSAGGRLREIQGQRREILTHGFPRGLVWTERCRFVGLSAHVYDRVKREHSESSIQVFDAAWTPVQRIKLDGCGPVNEIRAPFAGDKATSMGAVPLPRVREGA